MAEKKDALDLPLRATLGAQTRRSIDSTIAPLGYCRYGEIKLTKREMITITGLLTQKKTKEIARQQGCSESAEKQRLLHIKKKFGCQDESPSVFFNALKYQGVTLSCLEKYIMCP